MIIFVGIYIYFMFMSIMSLKRFMIITIRTFTQL